jgi:hypothetical protein
MKQIKTILLILVFTLFLSTMKVSASSMSIDMDAPAWRNWADAGTVTKDNWTQQTVVYDYSKYNRNLCTDITWDGSGSSYFAHCGDEGDTMTYTSQLLQQGGEEYVLHVRTQYIWMSKTPIEMTWNHD